MAADKETMDKLRTLRQHLAAACDLLDEMLVPRDRGTNPVFAVVSDKTIQRLQRQAKQAGYLGGSVALYLGKVLTELSRKGDDNGDEAE